MQDGNRVTSSFAADGAPLRSLLEELVRQAQLLPPEEPPAAQAEDR